MVRHPTTTLKQPTVFLVRDSETSVLSFRQNALSKFDWAIHGMDEAVSPVGNTETAANPRSLENRVPLEKPGDSEFASW
jgi:hypothetical protein